MADSAVATSGPGAQGEPATGVRRRDFLGIPAEVAALSAAGIGVLGALYPLVSQMAPSADVLAESSTEVDIAAIQPGQGVVKLYRKQPLFVRRLTPAEIARANAVDVTSLRDPETLAARTKPGNAQWLITMGVCTHLGCIPQGITPDQNRGEFGGYFCPCHGSQYDTAGRIRKGPAPKNLQVPDYAFESATLVKIG